ncbi:hypothetical protein PIB30_028163 [Stylosanthes scabra]|uniref:HTH myb-type domain-containing protein n=1 Tax=Stylosanthes scabra TaxID=79078 RepID=A0ABU6Y9D0_9FABA|nr:hypothetical protein [Stylosanthes scabra]
MGSVPAELSLQIRTPEAPPPPPPSSRSFIPKTITDFISGLSTSEITASEKQSTINDFLSHLEDEYNKIHAFKRELPLSMLLLGDAIVELKEQLAKCSEGACKSQPVLEEFIPLKKEFDHSEDDEEHVNNDNNNNNNRKEKECRDKKSWLSSVQLWNTSSSILLNNNNNNNNAFDNNHKHHHQNHHHKFGTKKNQECVVEDPFQSRSNVRNNNGGRGFMPFTSYSSCSVPVTTVALSASKEEKEDIVAINRLPLLTPAAGVGGVKTLREGSGSSGSRTSSNNRPVSSSSPPAAAVHRSTAMMPLQPQQTARKQRRCWSPELHRRFVNALQKLGGSQVATPKQIRELMQVDGLTNDEVKSHLQKYRLHTRRVPSGSGNHNHNQSVVVLGGLWMSQGQDQCNDSSKGSSSGSGSPQSPLHLATGSRGGMSPTEGDDSMEDDEDEKSESYSWKSHTHHKQVKVVDV